ncbi:hypothetical protein [Lysinibacillus sp. fls2-241-R2A-57]|uniref:hypothetical protein n=1 Tax=Lysinibacillus sp. fls2-241-R2A-57 TaxID=3040292 RepID=UPI0025579118|nr:hypothetical protein [Lysinibacillus sp. fls2-241-R2A-57]
MRVPPNKSARYTDALSFYQGFMGFTKIKNYCNRKNRPTDSHRCEPIELKQSCLICKSNQTIRRGISYRRTVRHLDAFGCRVYLKLPAIRLSCKAYIAAFVWHYEFVAPNKRYTKAFETTLPKQAIGATITHTARVTETPATTVARIVKTWKKKEASRVQQACQHKASHCQNLVLGLDDFAIRKGHTYNTGLHDLRNGTFLDIIPGRTILEL